MTLYFEQILMSASVDQFVRRVKYVKTLLGISHVCVRKAPCSMLMETVKVRKICTNLLTNKFLAPFVLAITVVEPTKVVVPPSVSAMTSSQAPPPPMMSTVLATPVVEPTKVVVPPSVSATTTSSQAPPPPMMSTVLATPVVEPTKVVVPPSVSATTTSSQAPPPPMTSTVALVTPTPDARYFLIVTIPGLTVETVANNHTQCFFPLDTHVSYFSSTVLC